MRILRIAMNGEEYPNYTFTKAFESVFEQVDTIWWENYDIPSLNELIKSKVREGKYDAVFLQIQSDGIINLDTAQEIERYSLGFNWTGDVRNNIDWYIRLGEHLVTLFTNMTDVEKLRRVGRKSDYLQTGYDKSIYFPIERESHNNIVFCGNYYPNADFPLTEYRKEMCYHLKKNYGDRFNLYGQRWEMVGLKQEAYANNNQEAEIYRTCSIAVSCSHFNYSRYFSDRLLREMACGALVLSHKFQDYEKEFIDGKHFVIWNDFDDLIEKCNFYLNNKEKAKEIAFNGQKYVLENYTWEKKIKELKNLIIKYKKNG